MLRVGKKFLKPHFCPECGELVILVRHPLSQRCPKCQQRYHRKKQSHKAQQRKYNTGDYRRRKAATLRNHPYCALCGSTHDLTCHHAVRVKSGEWKGQHLTVLRAECHRIWETKVNKIRSMEMK